jgi:hypothetical protein
VILFDGEWTTQVIGIDWRSGAKPQPRPFTSPKPFEADWRLIKVSSRRISEGHFLIAK